MRQHSPWDVNAIQFVQALETAHRTGARPFRTAAAEEDTPDLTTTSRRLPLLIGTTSLRIAVHHSLVIVEIHKIEELFRRPARPGQSKLGLVLIPKIGSEWPAGATVNQTIVLTQRRKRVGRMDSSRKLWMDCGAWSKAEMACCRRADLHEVPLAAKIYVRYMGQLTPHRART